MARIIGVHGIANTFLGSAQLTRTWREALQGGLDEAGGPQLSDSDVHVVAYGALFRPDADGNERPPTRVGRSNQPVSLSDVWEHDLVEAWWRAAAALSAEQRRNSEPDERGEDPGIQSPEFKGRARTPQLVQRGLVQLAKTRFFKPLAPTVLISELRQVRLFLHDPHFKRAILERFVDRIRAANPAIVIGHSLGSVVAYEALCAHPEWNIDTFITLGSPLGIPNVVFDTLDPRPRNNTGAWPHVARWVNVADKGDLVALVKALGPLFGPVQDVLTYNGWKSHDVARYLTARETGQAVAQALARQAT